MSQNSRIKFFKEIEKYQQQKIFATQRFDRLYVLIGIFFHILTFFYDVRHSNNVKKSEYLLFSVIGRIWGEMP